MTDAEMLKAGVCPDCRNPIDKYFVTDRQPWCQSCDTYYTSVGDFVCRNVGALKQYNDWWEEHRDEMPDAGEYMTLQSLPESDIPRLQNEPTIWRFGEPIVWPTATPCEYIGHIPSSRHAMSIPKRILDAIRYEG